MGDEAEGHTPGSRSSSRLKSRKPFRMPSREDVLGKIEPDRTPHKSFDHLRPRKLVTSFVKGHNRYNNLDPISLWDEDSMSDFITDEDTDEDTSSEEEEESSGSTSEGDIATDTSAEEKEKGKSKPVIKKRPRTHDRKHEANVRKRRKSNQIISDDDTSEEGETETKSTCRRRRNRNLTTETKKRQSGTNQATRTYGRSPIKKDCDEHQDDEGGGQLTKIKKSRQKSVIKSSDEESDCEGKENIADEVREKRECARRDEIKVGRFDANTGGNGKLKEIPLDETGPAHEEISTCIKLKEECTPVGSNKEGESDNDENITIRRSLIKSRKSALDSDDD